MALSEFDLINRYFSGLGGVREDVILGVGDDCAIVRVPPGRELLISMDTLVEGRHFSAGVDPRSLGHKVLAVSLSDLAAMGAEPAWVTLSLTLPAVESAMLEAFAAGFDCLAREHGVQLVGGDMTGGPLSITVQAQGFVEPGCAIRRDGARDGDLVYVTGTVGDAGLALLAAGGLAVEAGQRRALDSRLHRPVPRLAQGRALRGLATAAIDVSDGLAADLGHICAASGLGACIEWDKIPLSVAVAGYVAAGGDRAMPLAAGDDYELVFTVPPGREAELEELAASGGVPVSYIGRMQAAPGVRVRYPDGSLLDPPSGFDHFSG